MDFSGAIEQMADALVITDATGIILYVNPAFTRMTGYSAAEAIGQNPRFLKSGAQDPAYYQDLWNHLREGKPWRGELVNRRKDGSCYTEEMMITPMFDADGGISGYIAVKHDVTERRIAEDTQKLLASIVESTDDAVITRTRQGRILTWNRAAEALCGYCLEEVQNRPISMLVAPESLEKFQQVFEAVNRGESCLQFELIVLAKGGQRKNVSISTTPLKNSSGAVTAGVSIVRDITERKRAEQALQDSEARFRAAFQLAPAGICLSASDRRILRANAALCRMLGYSEQELIERGWWGVTHPDDRPISQASCDNLMLHPGAQIELEKRYVRKDGRAVWARVRISVLRQTAEEDTLFISHIEDVTGRKCAEEIVRRSEERYRQLVNNIPDVVWTADSRGNNVFVSPNCERVYGYTPQEICQPRGWWSRIHADDLSRVQLAYNALLTRGEPYDIEYQIRSKSGELMWVHDRAVSTYESGGQRFIDGCQSDITERKRSSELIETLQRRNELILESAGEGILGLDSECRCTFVNPAAAAMLGSAADAFIGRDISRVAPHTCGGDPCVPETCALTASIRDGSSHRGADIVFTPPGRGSFPAEFVSTPKIDRGRLAGAVVLFRDVTQSKRAQERIEASLKEKEALLREIHHRVKNNLQIVCSLLKLNSRGLTDAHAKRVMEDTQHRVKAMALVHETLYRSGDLAGIDFCEYVPRLAGQLLHAYGLTSQQVRLTLDVDSAVLPIDVAIPCALMLTELISNAAKHVFTHECSGALRVEFRRAATTWLLRVENSESRPTPDPPAGRAPSFGLELVRLLTEQLNGSVEFERASGFRASIVFPAPVAPGESETS